jgi:hypothetical protein
MYMLNGLTTVLVCSNFAMYNNLVVELEQIKEVIYLVYQKKTPLLNTAEFLRVCSAFCFMINQIMQIIQGGRAVEVDRLLDQQRMGDHYCQVEIHLGVRLGLVDRLRVGHELA